MSDLVRVIYRSMAPLDLCHLLIENIKRSTQGKLAAATQVQSAEYLKPLFKTLRSRVRVPIPVFNSFVLQPYLSNLRSTDRVCRQMS